MGATILLYGATGYSGRLIAAEAAFVRDSGLADAPFPRVILAGRDERALRALADAQRMDFRTFALDDRPAVLRGLGDVDVVVNAAGPFAWTAERLATAALESGAHYVDINGEVDVYQKLDDLARPARLRHCAIVCGAGCTGAASDILLDRALAALATSGRDAAAPDFPKLGAVRVAMSRVAGFSRGSVETALRSLREQVTVVRRADVDADERTPWQAPATTAAAATALAVAAPATTPDAKAAADVLGEPAPSGTPLGWDMAARPEAERAAVSVWLGERMKVTHEPVGKLERSFDFRVRAAGEAKGAPDLRIASAADLVDTLMARQTLARRFRLPESIESYVDMGSAGRIAYQVGALLAPIAAMPWLRALASAQVELLPDGPTAEERAEDRHVVLLEVEDVWRTRLVDWRWETPNPYQFTAQIVVAVAATLARARRGSAGAVEGFVTPAAVLGPGELDIEGKSPTLRGCRLDRRIAG